MISVKKIMLLCFSLLSCFWTLCLAHPIFASKKASTEIQLSFDKNLSAFSASSVIQSGFDTYTYLLPYHNTKQGFGYGALRALRIGFDSYLSAFLSIVKHEYSGHGFRLREFDYKITKYEFNLDASGVTYYLLPMDDELQRRINKGSFFIEGIAVTAGGIESSDVMANRIALQTLETTTMNVGLSLQ